jgi:caa(3)-type oxidase subunit IV
MESVLRTRATSVWAVLVIATTISWALGSDQGFGPDGHTLASVVILVVALFKVRLVGLYFMELREAPPALRGVFEGYCVAVCGLTIGMFLLV